ncbi:MAG: hypothetical protein A2445_04830 [Candidatus Jacksonbacteria bacterium RIFOXYC2_FULL_44_29]|nr:MAG: Glycosyl transferase family 2 [Parcubacteria group bacterium GW2011_GWC2_44_22]OGY75185.1 MAG: hypothetical protein A2240_01115 [Candidatus Jacksonbacteria bacterium RIFOXYA2_FULL_43_12]OGY75647.1 MAG: hypothetical protein A2295_04710 [Candidatus Jacksonbacteria bacterium RIFOXYB2_FULL_44_15]OGY77791.1 MAG: hypothetical protein A2445_04830 [Candidatus Jacksonbacteria bacterium RIFOXYC2_FULL_44_29]OGY79521.1 MAG: hypothetical protein A2550_02120 [Candidatus Jacksonbacteria bacterium RIFO
MFRVALILVNYNGLKYLPDLFASIAQLDYPRDQADIFFVDNSSSDGSLAWARDNADQLNRRVNFIASEKNLGFAGGNNLALRQILESNNYEYAVMLNIDTVTDAKFLSELVKKVEADLKIGAVQSLILLHDDPKLINTSGNALHYLGFGWAGNYQKEIKAVIPSESRGQPEADHPLGEISLGLGLPAGRDPSITLAGARFSRDDSHEVGYCSGAAVLYRIDILRQIGLLDEKFFMYHEDLELGWRIRLAGCKNVLAPESIVYHKYQFSRHKKKWFWTERNRLLVYFSLYRWQTLLILAPVFLFVELGMLAYSLIGGWFWYKLRSYIEVLLSINYIIDKRRRIRRLRQVGDQMIFRQMTGKFDFAEIKNPVITYIVNPILLIYFWLARVLVRW